MQINFCLFVKDFFFFFTAYRFLLLARIKIYKAYILHDQGEDEEAKKEADEAEQMLGLTECHEDTGELNNIQANIILSASKNGLQERKHVLFHLDKSIQSCEKSTVDRSVTIVQATIRKALCYLGYYQHGILKDIRRSDVGIAETILNRVSQESKRLSKRSKVYYAYGQSLLAYRKGRLNVANKLEHKARRKCERHKISFEIQQLDMLRTLMREGSH